MKQAQNYIEEKKEVSAVGGKIKTYTKEFKDTIIDLYSKQR